MVNIVRTRRNSIDSPRMIEVGEIDTKVPFQSVKAAVSLFGEVSSPKDKPLVLKKARSEIEGVLDKEAQLHLALTELGKLKEQVKYAQAIKTQVLPEIEKAKRTLLDLKEKLNVVNQTKQTIIEEAEALKTKARKLEDEQTSKRKENNSSEAHDSETSHEHYKATIIQLDALKQELSSMRSDFNATAESKIAAFRQVEEARLAVEVNTDKASEISKQIAAMRESLDQLRFASQEALQEQARIITGKDADIRPRRLSKEAVEQKLLALRKEQNPQVIKNLESELVETNTEIESLHEQVTTAKTSFLEAAKGALERVQEERKSLQIMVNSLRQEFETIYKDINDANGKVVEAESLASMLHTELEKRRIDLEIALVNKATTTQACDEMISTMEQLSSETTKARQETKDIKESRTELKQEAGTTRQTIAQMEKKLSEALPAAKEAKASEKHAHDEMQVMSKRAFDGHASTTSNNQKVKLSNEEYKSLSESADEYEKLANMKEAAATAYMEALNASRNEAAQKIELGLKVIEELKSATWEALKKREMAEAATKVLETELHRRRQQEQMQATP